MAELTPHYQQLKRAYIFPIIESKVEELKASSGPFELLNFGVGDIALPLAPTLVEAICSATQEMGRVEGIRGYGPGEGYAFLREAIATQEYGEWGIDPEEIFVSDGINSDISAIEELFALDATPALPDPAYPVYLDSCLMAGRGGRVFPLPCTEETGFLPRPPDTHCDFLYLCTPHNPTGAAMNRAQLTEWVAYAQREEAILLVDSAYACFVHSPDVPRSIYAIEGAKEVAIEFKSFSKSAGFTGLRCAYTVLPKRVLGRLDRKKQPLHPLWKKRQNIRTNGVSYPIQRGAEASLFSPGKEETKRQVESYRTQAKRLREGLGALGYRCFGGTDSPYIWWQTPGGIPSWEFFDTLLEKCHLVAIPGKGFGARGEGFVRLSAFTTEPQVTEALKRIARL